jgi:hypothetical protein
MGADRRMSATAELQGSSTSTSTGSWTVIFWAVIVGLLQAFSPLAFWWLDQDVVWAAGLVVIGSIYIGFAVADGRKNVIAVELIVASAFIILGLASIGSSPWLAVFGLAAHGFKDLWQHRTNFVATTRWWPPFCLVVDFVVAPAIAVLLILGVELNV